MGVPLARIFAYVPLIRPEGAANFLNWNLAARDACCCLWSVWITRYISMWKSRHTRIECTPIDFLSVCHDFDISHQNFFIGIATFTHEVSPDLEYMSSPFCFKGFKIVFPFVNFEMSKFSRLSVELSYRSVSLYTLLNFQFQSQFSIFIHNICWTYQDKTLFMWYSLPCDTVSFQ